MLPPTTPREVLYIETGLLDIETIILRNRVTMQERLKRNTNQLLERVSNEEIKNGWSEENNLIKQKLNINEQDTNGTITQIKHKINTKARIYFKNKIEREGDTKSKVKYLIEGVRAWEPVQRPQYMYTFTRQESSILFKARTRMLDVKNNYRGKYSTNICRLCNMAEETQEHILEQCKTIHKDITTTVKKHELFSKIIEELKQTVKKITRIMTILNN